MAQCSNLEKAKIHFSNIYRCINAICKLSVNILPSYSLLAGYNLNLLQYSLLCPNWSLISGGPRFNPLLQLCSLKQSRWQCRTQVRGLPVHNNFTHSLADTSLKGAPAVSDMSPMIEGKGLSRKDTAFTWGSGLLLIASPILWEMIKEDVAGEQALSLSMLLSMKVGDLILPLQGRHVATWRTLSKPSFFPWQSGSHISPCGHAPHVPFQTWDPRAAESLDWVSFGSINNIVSCLGAEYSSCPDNSKVSISIFR